MALPIIRTRRCNICHWLACVITRKANMHVNAGANTSFKTPSWGNEHFFSQSWRTCDVIQ